MTRVLVFVHPVRTLVPSSGVGRHVNSMVLELAARPEVEVELFFSKEWVRNEKNLPENCPLRGLPFRTYTLPERVMERSWKICGKPGIERHLAGFDVIYSPAETAIPISSIPAFVTLHDIYPLDPLYPGYERKPRLGSQRRRWDRWIPRVFRQSSAVLTVSEFCKNRMQELLNTHDCPIHVIGNGVDPIFFDAAQFPISECRRPGDWPYALVVGGLTSRKGAEQTLQVAKALQRSGSEIRIVVSGRSEPQWERAAAACPNVVLGGPLPDELLVQYLRAANCLLFLSLYEGFGIPVVEAMACGTPVIVSNRASLPEVAGDAAKIVDPDCPDEVVEALEAICVDTNSRALLCVAGRKRAENFTWKACVNRLDAVFRNALIN